MPPTTKEIFPFLTRKMLSFEQGTIFQLDIDSWGNDAGKIYISGITKEGAFSFNYTPTADGLKTNAKFNIPDIPIFLSVFTKSAPLRRGQVYASISLNINSTRVYKFTSGYVTTGSNLTWPNGQEENNRSGMGNIRTLTSADPAAGAELLQQVPTGALWRIHSLMITLVADATVANRVVQIGFQNPLTTYVKIPAPAAQTATQTITYIFGIGLTFYNDIVAGIMTIPLPQDAWLHSLNTIITTTTGLVAGDNFSAAYIRLEELVDTQN